MTGYLGAMSKILGRWGEALEHHESHRGISREIGHRLGEGVALTNLGPLYAALGDGAAAGEALCEGREILQSIGARQAESYAIHELGRLAEQRGAAEQAHHLFAEALELRRELGYPKGVAATQVALGRLQVANEQWDDARESLDEAIRSARDLDAVEILATACGYRALLPDGDSGAATAVLAENEDRLRHEVRMEAHHVCWRSTGDPEHLAAARRLLEEVRQSVPKRYQETMISNVPLHDAIANG